MTNIVCKNCYQIKIVFPSSIFNPSFKSIVPVSSTDLLQYELETHTINTGVMPLSLDEAQKLSKRRDTQLSNYFF